MLLSTASQEGEAKREVLISPPWDPATGSVGKAQSCARGASDWTLGGILERWWMPQDSVFKKLLDKVVNNIL